MPELASLVDLIAKTFGQYAPMVYFAIGAVALWLKNRYYPQPANSSQQTGPLLDLILKALSASPKDRPATAADMPHELHMRLQSELDDVSNQKAAALSKQMADFTKLGLVDTPPKV